MFSLLNILITFSQNTVL